MITFINETVRMQFHLMPHARQIEIESAFASLKDRYSSILVIYADAETLELCIRIDDEVQNTISIK